MFHKRANIVNVVEDTQELHDTTTGIQPEILFLALTAMLSGCSCQECSFFFKDKAPLAWDKPLDAPCPLFLGDSVSTSVSGALVLALPGDQ